MIACDAENSETANGDDSTSDATSSENTNTPNSNLSDATSNSDPVTTELDGSWLSDCITRDAQASVDFEQESLFVEGSFYERTINLYQDSNCSVPADMSFIRVRSTGLQYPGGSVQTELGSASQIVVTSPMIDFDRRLLTTDEAELFDPALYFYDFYLFESDGRLHFGSMNTLPASQFEQSLDSPHVFTAQ